MIYRCALVDRDGIVVKLFYREGKSKDELLRGLEIFQWPAGHWVITRMVEEKEESYND